MHSIDQVLQVAAKPIEFTEIRTASLGGTNGLDAMKNIFDMTWSAVTHVRASRRGETRCPISSAT